MSYMVLPRPEGTYATKPTLADALMPGIRNFGSSMSQGITDQMYKQAAAKEGLAPSYRKNADGTWSIAYEKPETDVKGILFALAGLKPMDSVMPKEEITKQAPYSFGEMAGGGEVGIPGGSTFDNGIIRNAAGEMIGEYDPANPPQRTSNYQAAEEAARNRLTEKITSSPIARAALGIKDQKVDKPNMTEDFRAALQEAEDVINRGADPEVVKDRLISLYGDQTTDIQNWFAAKSRKFRGKSRKFRGR